MTTDPSALPQWKGRPVPWVTRWTGQIIHESVNVGVTSEGQLYANYPNGEQLREDNGVLWMKEALNRAGTPEYAQVSSWRQRASMLKRLCQVCGKKIPPGPITWLFPRTAGAFQEREEGAIVTSPPTCEDCVPLALELCPHLKQPGAAGLAKVLEYEIWGAFGQRVYLDDQLRAKQARGMIRYANAPYYPFPLSSFVARQQVVLWTKYIIEE